MGTLSAQLQGSGLVFFEVRDDLGGDLSGGWSFSLGGEAQVRAYF